MANLKVAAGTGSLGIQHQITGANHFSGELPTVSELAPVTFANGLNKFTPDTAGGLFSFENLEPIIITQIHLQFNEDVNYTLSVVNLDAAGAEIAGEGIVFTSGIGNSYRENGLRLTLTRNQALKVVTEGGAPTLDGMIGRVLAFLERAFQG